MARPKKEPIPENELLYERFYNARTRYNQHGMQSTVAVEDGCGVRHSLIEDAENRQMNPPRAIDYLTVKKLADYYGVCADYLLGLDDNPVKETSIRAIQEYIGLSDNAIRKLRKIQDEPGKSSRIAVLNSVLENDKLGGVLSQLSAAKAEIEESHVIDYSWTATRTYDEWGRPNRTVDAAGYVQMLASDAEKQMTDIVRAIIDEAIGYQLEIDGSIPFDENAVVKKAKKRPGKK